MSPLMTASLFFWLWPALILLLAIVISWLVARSLRRIRDARLSRLRRIQPAAVPVSSDATFEQITTGHLGACAIDDRQARLQLDDYLQLVDQTGRALKEGKAGRIPPELRPLLERLDLDADAWLQEMRGSGFLLGAAIGSVAARAAEAARRGARWVVDTVAGLYRQPQAG